MPGFAFRVTGATETAAAFARLAGELDELDLGGIGALGRGELERDSPRLTGALAASWSVTERGGALEVGTDLRYAAVQNYGGYHNITGQHFLERAAALVDDGAGRLVSAEIDRLIERM